MTPTSPEVITVRQRRAQMTQIGTIMAGIA